MGGGALPQYDWYLYKNRKFGFRSIQREDGMKTQGEDNYQQTKEREASKEASLQTLESVTSSLQKCETIHL